MDFQQLLPIVMPVAAIAAAWGSLRNQIKEVKFVMDTEIRPDIRSIKERLSVLEPKVDILWVNSYGHIREREHAK